MSGADTVLVTGATGHVGRHVVAGLLRRGVRVRAFSRGGGTGVTDGLQRVSGDLTSPADVQAAADGVEAVFLLWPFFSADAAAPAVTTLARTARRIVYLSAMSVRDDGDPQANGVWGELEHLIAASGAEWSFLRAGGFATNTLMWAEQIRTDATVRWQYGRADRSLVHEQDLADVEVAVLGEPGHGGRSYVLTGPEAVTQQDQVAQIGEAIGRPVRWQEMRSEQARG
jgi:uncharacterized protein YbjT (DUF2867 family)